jgi:hypothetical protein
MLYRFENDEAIEATLNSNLRMKCFSFSGDGGCYGHCHNDLHSRQSGG